MTKNIFINGIHVHMLTVISHNKVGRSSRLRKSMIMLKILIAIN